MKLYMLVCLVTVALLNIGSRATAESTATEKQDLALLEAMPACGRSCLIDTIEASPCLLTNTTCSCSNSTISDLVELCVLANCTVKQQLTSKNITQTLCQAPIRNKTASAYYPGITGGVLALFAYTLRMVSRMPCLGGGLGWDDLILTVAMLEVIAMTVLVKVLSDLGLGKDIWTLPFSNITELLKVYYFDEDLYLTALPMVKISIVMFYLRIFPQPLFRKVCYGTNSLCVGYGLAFLLVSVFQCRPINYAWLRWDGEHHGNCNNINAQGWTSAAINVVLDFVIIALPIPMVAKLNMNRRKKFLVMLMFSLGLIVTVVSILRLQVLVEFGASGNFTWNYTKVGYWSTSEVDLAIICACLPAIRGLISRVMPRTMGESTKGLTDATPYASRNSGRNEKRSGAGSRLSSTLIGSERDPIKGERDFIPLVEVTPVDHVQTATSDGSLADTIGGDSSYPARAMNSVV